MILLAKRLEALGTENAFKLGEDIARVADRGMDVIKFNLGEPDFDTAPHINEAAIAAINKGESHYCNPAGIQPFREIIAKHISATRGIDVSPDRVIVTPGAKPPIGYTIQTYVNEGDEVIYPSPGFPIYESWVTFVGATPVPLQLKEEQGFAFTPEELSALITDKTKVIILNSPSNPTGGVQSKVDLSGIAAVIRDKCRPDVRIYSDEVYEHILFDGENNHSIASEDGMAERTVLVSGHSKGFAMTGWRLGYAILPTTKEAAIFKQLNINIVSCVPPFVQHAGMAAYENPKTADTVHNMVEKFQERRDSIVGALNGIDGITCQSPKGAFYVFPNIGGACESLGIFEAYETLPEPVKARTCPSAMFQMYLLYSHGVATMDRNSFGHIGAEGQHFLRLSYATGMDNITEGLSRITKAVADNGRFQDFLKQETHLYS